MTIATLLRAWRDRAAQLERYAPEVSRAIVDCAAELERVNAERANETLTLVDAAKESGFTPGALGRMIRKGRVENAGRANAPRIRRADLPVKPGAVAGPQLVGNLDGARRRAISSRIP